MTQTKSAWPSVSDLLTGEGVAAIALLGAPMGKGSVTPGRCDLAPETIRRTFRRFSTYEVATGEELEVAIRDLGDVPVQELTPAEGFAPIRDAVAGATAGHALTILLGGNNAVTRPAAHGLGAPLEKVGLITLDAHLDMRDTDRGPLNGNPIRCLLEEGLPGRNICQIGLAPFANTRKMREDAEAAGVRVIPMTDCELCGTLEMIGGALDHIAHTDVIMIDFDIDVIDRAQCPGAPGARPGGMKVDMFFAATRYLASQPKVKLVDLTEFDPSLDVSDITALTAGRWVCEVLAGYSARTAR